MQSFKGIFVRGLKELSNALNTQWYASLFENQVNSIIPLVRGCTRRRLRCSAR